MKKVIFNSPPSDTINIKDINIRNTSIFAKKNGKLYGMVIREEKGFICRIDSNFGGANGHHETIRECIESCMGRLGYEFFVDIDC